MTRLATLFIAGLLSVPTALGAINNETPATGPVPQSESVYRFTVTADTPFGRGVSVEIHPQGDLGNYIATPCLYLNDAGGGLARFTCDVNFSTLPAAFDDATVEYQFFKADYNTNNNRSEFTGFNFTYETTPSGLPVELTSFTAVAAGDGAALLRWTTESETDNAGFAVERRLASGTWAEAAFVAGRGTTSERTSYAHRIDGLPAGRHAFRLVQRDLDGSATVAGTVELALTPSADVAVSQRRTVQGVVLGVTPREAQAVRVEAFDVAGRRVAVLFEAALDGTADVVLDRARFAAGVYVVRITGERFDAARSVVVR